MKIINLVFKKAFPVLVFSILFASCKGDKDVDQTQNAIEFITLDNKKIANVTIKNGTILLGKSDKEGNYVLDKKKLKLNSTLVFEHEDFITRYIINNKNTLGAVYMKPRNEAIRIDSKEGKKITTKSNVSIEIPENAFSQNGKPYSGEVDITISSIDANNFFDIRSAPAPFIAQNSTTGELVPLTSYGIVEVLATTPKGTPLDLIDGINLPISIPVTIKETPEKVNLYELNTETGYWDLSGVLTNTNNFLVGEVTSVNSSWNADDPCSSTLVCVRIKIEYAGGVNNPCYGARTGAQGLSYQGHDGDYFADASGYVQFSVCPNSAFELQNCFLPCSCPNGGGYRNTKMIDLSTVTMPTTGCYDLGTWTIP